MGEPQGKEVDFLKRLAKYCNELSSHIPAQQDFKRTVLSLFRDLDFRRATVRGYGFKFSGDFWKSAGDLSNGSWTPKKRGRPTKKDKTPKDDETGLMDSQTSLMEQTPPTPTVSLDVKEEGDGEDPTGGVG